MCKESLVFYLWRFSKSSIELWELQRGFMKQINVVYNLPSLTLDGQLVEVKEPKFNPGQTVYYKTGEHYSEWNQCIVAAPIFRYSQWREGALMEAPRWEYIISVNYLGDPELKPTYNESELATQEEYDEAVKQEALLINQL